METKELKILGPVEISGFKSIRHCKLDLRNINILIGANGSGKSNFIGFFKFIRAIYLKQLQRYRAQEGGPDAVLRFGRKRTNELKAKLHFGSFSYEFCLIPTMDNLLVFKDESTCKNNTDCISLGSNHQESKLDVSTVESSQDTFIRTGIENLKVYHFHDTSESASVKGVCQINDNVSLHANASNLASYLLLIKERHAAAYRNIVDVVRLAAPFIKDFHLRPDPLNPDTIQFEWISEYTESPLKAHALSDGTLRFICLATLLLQPIEKCPNTILLDEPELGLHPYAISLLAGMIKNISLQKQIIAATQSPLLVNDFEPEDILIAKLENGCSTFSRLQKADYESWLKEYALGELWQKNLFGGNP